MYVRGVAKTKFGILNESVPELAYEAMTKAVHDAGLPIEDIQVIYVANFAGGPLQNQLQLNSVIASLLPGINIPIIRVETACASAGAATFQALHMLKSFNNIMVVGVEKMTNLNIYDTTKGISSAGDLILDQKEGLSFPASYALVAQQHMLQYGTSEEDLALISLKDHQNANMNPLAHFYEKQVTMEMIKHSPVVCSPLKLFDCSPVSDGAAALILSRKRDSDRDIEVVGSALATDTISFCQRKNLTSFQAAKVAAREAYSQAGITGKQVDFAEVHDCFTIAEIVAMEDLGFCEQGQGKKMIRDGETRLGGRLPIGTDGGLKANGHPIGATGASQIYEIVTQLRGEAGKRQVKDARYGLSHNIGGVGGTCAVHILKR
jgi:acetyl-CoA C-acetyltransferase